MTTITDMEGITEKTNNSLVDFHAHVLPGADHGSTGLLCSKKQIQQALAAKVRTIVATPHFYPQKHSLDAFLAVRTETHQEILPFALENGINIIAGAEVLACVGIEKMEGVHELCCGTKRVLLVEMPTDSSWTYKLCESVFALQDEKGFRVLLAHIDRYKDENIDYLLSGGLMAQINADAVCNRFKRKRLLKLIDEGHVVALGSDIHGEKQGYRDYIKAVEIINKHTNDFMTRSNILI